MSPKTYTCKKVPIWAVLPFTAGVQTVHSSLLWAAAQPTEATIVLPEPEGEAGPCCGHHLAQLYKIALNRCQASQVLEEEHQQKHGTPHSGSWAYKCTKILH